MSRALLLASLLGLSGCWVLPIRWERIARVRPADDRAPSFQVRTHLWPGTTDRRRQIEGHFHPDGHADARWRGRFVPHGTETEWYRSGQVKSVKHFDLGREDGTWTYWHENGRVQAERTWELGEPCGVWRTWHPNGRLASEIPMVDELASAKWWYANGVVSSYGPARRGVREGEWIETWRSGAIRAFGPYVGGERNGTWTFLHEDGSLRMRGRYLNNARTGSWERWEPGERFVVGR